jgi:hypothetical protein
MTMAAYLTGVLLLAAVFLYAGWLVTRPPEGRHRAPPSAPVKDAPGENEPMAAERTGGAT